MVFPLEYNFLSCNLDVANRYLEVKFQYLRQKWTVLYGLDIASEYDKHTALTGL